MAVEEVDALLRGMGLDPGRPWEIEHREVTAWAT